MRFNPFRVYKRLLHERPLITNVLTTCTFMTAGDLISQSIIQGSHEYDLKQTGTFALAGLVFVGPVVRGCLVTIDKVFGPTSGLKVLGKKLFLDQICIAPIFIACNIAVLTVLKTQSFDEVTEELNRNYYGILKMNYTFWPFVQVLNFYFIPLTYRVVFGSTAALLWNTLFSYRLYNKKRLMEQFQDIMDDAEQKIRHP